MKSLLERSLKLEIQRDKLIDLLSKHSAKNSADSQNVSELATLIEPFLGSILSALEVATRFSKDPQFGRTITFATGQIIAYCFDEQDLFPERDYGILGLLDDAYLVHRFASMLLEIYPKSELDNISYRLPDNLTLDVVRTLLPEGVCDALDRTCYNLIQVSNALFASGARESNSIESLAKLRIDEAISIIQRKSKAKILRRRKN